MNDLKSSASRERIPLPSEQNEQNRKQKTNTSDRRRRVGGFETGGLLAEKDYSITALEPRQQERHG